MSYQIKTFKQPTQEIRQMIKLALALSAAFYGIIYLISAIA